MSDNCHGMGDSSELNFYLLSYLITIERVTVKKNIMCFVLCGYSPFLWFFYRWFFLGFRKEKYCWFLIFWCFLFLFFISTDSKLIQNKNVEKNPGRRKTYIYIFSLCIWQTVLLFIDVDLFFVQIELYVIYKTWLLVATLSLEVQ